MSQCLICQSEYASLNQIVNIVIIFSKKYENTYPKGRALMQMYSVVPQTNEAEKVFVM